MKKQLTIATSLTLLSALAVTYTQCGRSAHVNAISQTEIEAVGKDVFSVTPIRPDTDIEDDETNQDDNDSYIPLNPYKSENDPFRWVSRCNQLESHPAEKDGVAAYIASVAGNSGVKPGVSPYQDIKTSRDFELAVVKKIAEQRLQDINAGKTGPDGKPLPLLIPVEFTFSTGNKHDTTSYMAYRRSILRNDHDGVSYLQTSKNTYIVNHEEARANFIEGKNLYYSLVKVDKVEPDYNKAYANFVKNQKFGIWAAYNLHKVGSGLSNIEDYVAHYNTKKELPVGRIFLADVRDEITPTKAKAGIMYEDIANFNRNAEVTRRLKDIFKVKNVFNNRASLTHGFSVDREVDHESFKAKYTGYAGVPQLLHKMVCDLGSTSRIGAQYTPIVLDLGKPYIRTSSEHWGTFFNISDAKIMRDGGDLDANEESSYTHRTAWVGGYLKKVNNPIVSDLSSASTVVPFKQVWERVAEDGFLALPKAGKNISAKELFGASFVNPDKPEATYENGFLALQDYAGTSAGCGEEVEVLQYTGEGPTDEQLSVRYEQMKKRYLGPWNSKYNDLKIWVDANRDGISSSDEIKGLKEAGVLAINTCLADINEKDETDRFGNNTKLRSAFLYSEDQKVMSDSDILYAITMGKNLDGNKAEFRLMVDIFFKSRPLHFLERSLKFRSESIKKPDSYKVKIHGQVYGEEDTSVPLVFN